MIFILLNTIQSPFASGRVFSNLPDHIHSICNPDYIWTGAIDNNWFTADNWSPSGVPGSTDNVAIGINGHAEVYIQNGDALVLNIELSQNSYIEIASNASLDHSLNTFELYDGYLKGAGTFIGNVHVSGGGRIAPGNPNTSTIGTLTINGKLTTDANAGTLEIQANGKNPGQYSVLIINGDADMMQDLLVFYGNYNGNYYSVHKYDELTPINCNTIHGTFTNAFPVGWNPTYNDPATGIVKITYNPPPPENDDCNHAIIITNIPGNYGNYTINALNSLNAIPSCNSNGVYDIWFSFVAPTSGKILINNFPTSVHAISLWSGVCGNLSEVKCYAFDNNGQTCNQILATGLQSGQTYYIQEITVNEETNLNFQIQEPIGGPPNDYCEDAISISVGAVGDCPNGEISGTTLNAFHSYDVSCTNDWECNNLDVWYSFTTPASGLIKFKPTSGNLSAVFLSGSCGSLTQEACLGAEGTVILAGNTSYLLMISTRNNWPGGNFSFCLDEAPPPPANNTCDGAILIDVSSTGNCNYISGTTKDATSDKENPCAFGPDEQNMLDVWYQFEAPASGTITFHSGTSNPVASFYSGACSNLSNVDFGCLKGTGTIHNLVPAQQYYLQIMTPPGTGVDFDFCIEDSQAAPSNNDCQNAISINAGDDIQVASTIYARTNPGLPVCAPPNLNIPSLWYKFKANTDQITYDNNNAFILALTVYTGCNGSSDMVMDGCALPYNGPPILSIVSGIFYYAQISTLPAAESGYHFSLNKTGNLFHPDINVKGNGLSIADGDNSPDTNDNTDFGKICALSGTLSKTFTIENTGDYELNISSIEIQGLNNSDFSINGISLPYTVSSGSSVDFYVVFDPTDLNDRVAVVHIASDDPDAESIYEYAIKGTGGGIHNMMTGLFYCNANDAFDPNELHDGDELQIEAGTYSGGPCLVISKSIHIASTGGPVTIDCIEVDGNGKMMDLESDLTINNLTLMQGLIHLNGHHLTCGQLMGGSKDSYIVTN